MRNVYQAIMIASAQNKGLRLTPEEVRALAFDNAIETAAIDDLKPEQVDELDREIPNVFWSRQKPASSS